MKLHTSRMKPSSITTIPTSALATVRGGVTATTGSEHGCDTASTRATAAYKKLQIGMFTYYYPLPDC